MKTQIENLLKRIYTQPKIERIIIDNEISLVLRSDPSDPGNFNKLEPKDNFNKDPYGKA